ncbi:MAG: (deoxy)nucleoside triphosphate pyrophosphohydrolase [Actinomycetota bacterium]|nr:(deoxy)nucleoside triphosphate pyrophosphohydrolase [Actinomycetota bacterium]
MTPRPRLVVGAALVDDLERPSRVLAARRTAPPALAGGWELPGGKVEQGEEPLAALHRELGEELGVALEVGAHLPGPLPDGTWPLGGAHRMHVWLAAVASGTPAPLEDHDQLRWLTTADLYDVPWLPADLPVARALERLLARVVGGPTKP